MQVDYGKRRYELGREIKKNILKQCLLAIKCTNNWYKKQYETYFITMSLKKNKKYCAQRRALCA